MDHIGIDLYKRESQICLLAEGGELLERRIRTEPQRFAEALGGRAPAQVLRVPRPFLSPRLPPTAGASHKEGLEERVNLLASVQRNHTKKGDGTCGVPEA